MTKRYLLPCTCGKQIPVEPTQAGDTIHCDCGLPLDVPSLMEMRRLEPEESIVTKARGSQPKWGKRQAWLLAGSLITAAALMSLGYLKWNEPYLIPMDRMSMFTTWKLWEELRLGSSRFAAPEVRAYHDYVVFHRNWTYLAEFSLAAGLLTLIGSYVLIKPPAPER
jgi:hypothetical protein